MGPGTDLPDLWDPQLQNTADGGKLSHIELPCSGLAVLCLRALAGMATCDPKPYKIVGYDPLIRGQNP